jgi:hypothetical protein
MTIMAVEGPVDDLVDELAAIDFAARYTCVSCGRIKCRCGRGPAQPAAKPPKATMSTDLVEDEPCVTVDEWYQLNGHSAMAETVTAGTPWFSDVVPDFDDWPRGAPITRCTPGYLPDTGRPDHMERLRIMDLARRR